MRIPKSPLHVGSLPRDLIVEIILHVASSSLIPISDTRRLKASCKLFNDAANDKVVECSMNVGKECARMLWWKKQQYLALLERCARSGNCEASYILGLDDAFNKGLKSSAMRRLWTAMAGEHEVASYMAGMILFHDKVTRSMGMTLLNELATGDASCSTEDNKSSLSSYHRIKRCRSAAVTLLREMTFVKWRMDPSLVCTKPLCQRVVKRSNPHEWVDEELMKFCSSLCRWAYEYKMFVKKM